MVQPSAPLSMNPAAIAHAAGRMLDLALELGRLNRTSALDLDIDEGLSGHLPGAIRMRRSHAEQAAAASAAIAKLAQGLEFDADRLYRVAVNATDADRASGARMGTR